MSDKLAKFRVPIRACLFAIEKASLQNDFRLPENIEEELIFKCPVSSYLYARKVLRSRIPEKHEKIFTKGICFKQNYRSYDTKKMTSFKEVNISNLNFFNNREILNYYIDDSGNVRYTIELEADNFYIHNEYISVAFLYAKHVMKERFIESIEKDAFVNHPLSCFFYCAELVKNDCPIYLEEIIAKDSFALLNYALRILKSKLPHNLEEKLNPIDALGYASKLGILEEEIENKIFINDLSVASDYAINIKKSRFSNFLHDNMILASLDQNHVGLTKIKNYFTLCEQLDIMEKAWNFLCCKLNNFCNSVEKIFQNQFKFDLKFFNDKIILNQNVEIGKQNIYHFYVAHEKNYRPATYKIDHNYEEIVYEIISYCSYQILKTKIKELAQDGR